MNHNVLQTNKKTQIMRQIMRNIQLEMMGRAILMYSNVEESFKQTWGVVWTSIYGYPKIGILYEDVENDSQLQWSQQWTIVQ